MQREPRISEKERQELYNRSKPLKLKMVAVRAGIRPQLLRQMFATYGSMPVKYSCAVRKAIFQLEEESQKHDTGK